MTYWNGSAWEADRPADPPRPRRGRRFLGAATEAGLITLLMFGLIAGTTLAAPGGKGGGGGGKPPAGSLSLVLLDGGDSIANHMERAAFDVQTGASRPFVGVRCWQGGGMVLDGYTGYFEGYLFDPWVTLGSPYWADGTTADCIARLFVYDKRGNQDVLATLGFTTWP
jgi:hypothetical protein